MKISWIIPVFNSGKFLSEAIESILQNMPNRCGCEIILVNDCSTDAVTNALLEQWRSSPFVVLINQARNGGPSKARNAGIAAATGDWIAFLDADDVVAPDTLEHRVQLLEKYDEIRWIVGDMLETREVGKHSQLNNFSKATTDGEELSPSLFRIGRPIKKIAGWGMLPFLGAMMIRRDLLEKCGPLSEKLVYGEDIHFCLVLASLADMYWINRPVFHLRRYHESMTKNHLRAAREAPRASKFCLKDPRLKAVKKEMRWHYAANLRQSSGVFLQSGKRLQSMFYAARAVFWSPNDMRSLKALYRSCSP
ncbi:glycosyltransferase family 2 protein [Noviherbaspirillum soli]|uniref:glycosyltransferase family 2 protein n=1 Tax=Noviherbaspirillum soli TaxID=1064518 RepID=UPI00188C0CEF|nr:glycosyltransferase family A protein [Noviherbaspirillum soli]